MFYKRGCKFREYHLLHCNKWRRQKQYMKIHFPRKVKTASFRTENWRFLPEWRDSFAFSSRREENRGVAAVQPAARDSPPDCPIEIGSNPVLSKSKKTRHPVGVSCLFGPGDRIRTCGLMLPKHALYQAEPRPGTGWYYTPFPVKMQSKFVRM